MMSETKPNDSSGRQPYAKPDIQGKLWDGYIINALVRSVDRVKDPTI